MRMGLPRRPISQSVAGRSFPGGTAGALREPATNFGIEAPGGRQSGALRKAGEGVGVIRMPAREEGRFSTMSPAAQRMRFSSTGLATSLSGHKM